MSAPETLEFTVREGPTLNLFLRRGPLAAHLVATSGADPRVLVAFPAGNTGAALWLDAGGGPADVEVEGDLRPVSEGGEGALRGVSASIAIGAPAVRVRGAVLGSVRAIRDYAHRGETPAGTDSTVEAGPPVVLSRTTLDGRHRVVLRLAPRGGCRVEAPPSGPVTMTAAPGEPIRVDLTVLADDPPLTPIPRDELLVPGALADDHALKTLAFLAYDEKLLAGSWRFLTYFGRDTLLALRLLFPVLTPRMVRAGLGAVLDRIGPEGDVAHEEAVGEWATLAHVASGRPPEDLRAPVLDYTMVDDDFLLAPVAALALLDGAGRPREADPEILARRLPSGARGADALARNLALVLRRAAPFHAAPAARSLVALREGHAAGDWRDSEEGLGGGRIPFNVNAALVPAALAAAARLYASGLLGTRPGEYARARSLARAWAQAPRAFRVEIPEGEARRRAAAHADAMGIDPGPALAAIDGPVVFPALALDAAGAPIPVMHSDDGFVLLFTTPTPAALEEAAARVVRPFPAGLRTPAGLLVANPAFCADRAVRAQFTPAHYHGTVVWSWQHALLAAGIKRQLCRPDLPLSTRAALTTAHGVVDEILRASTEWRSSELWSVAARDGRLVRVPFGALRAHHDESNAAQLWSAVTGIAVGSGAATPS